MNAEHCDLGYKVFQFHDSRDFDEIKKSFFQDGVAFINGCDEQYLLKLANLMGTIVMPRNEKAISTGVNHIRLAPSLEGKAYGSEELFFHTDKSGWDLPPRVMITTLKTKFETGGQSLLVDSDNVVEYLQLHEPVLYKLVTSSKYISFKDDDGVFQPRPMYNETTGIFRLQFDDTVQMSATLIENLPKLRSIIYKNAFAVELQVGQCYAIDNHRFLHGRTSFTGSRELLNILAYPHPAKSSKYVLFDVDGTLCNCPELSIDAFYRCISDVSGKDIRHDNTKVNLHGQTDLSLVHDILEFHKIEREAIRPVVQNFFALHSIYMSQSIEKGFQASRCVQILETLEWLATQCDNSGHEVCIGLMTGNSRANTILKLTAAGIPINAFDFDISSFGNTCSSRLSLFQNSMRKIESKYCRLVEAGDIMLVGDTPLDVKCAKAVGCHIVAVATGNYAMEDLKLHGPDIVCESLKEATNYIKYFLSGRLRRRGPDE